MSLSACGTGAPWELPSQRRPGADRWTSMRKSVSHECVGFDGESFSSIDSVETLKAPPALVPISLIVERWRKPLCCSTGDRVAVDGAVDPSLLCLKVLVT